MSQMKELSREELDYRDRILRDLDARKSFYGKMQIKLAACRDRMTNTMALRFARVSFIQSGSLERAVNKQDYGDLVLAEFYENPENLKPLLEDLMINSTFKAGGFEYVAPFGIQNRQDYFVSSKSGWGFGSLDWPSNHYDFVGTNVGSFFDGPFLKPGLPPHQNLDEAVSAHFEYTMSGTNDRRIELLLPDYRARISRIVIDGRTIRVSLEQTQKNGVYAQFASTNANRKPSYSDTIEPKSSEISYTSPDEVSTMNIYIIDDSGKRIDARQADLRYAYIPPGVVIANELENLEAIVRRGESDTVEFKEIYDKDSVLRAAIAFANSKGGMIFIGVSDQAEIPGFKGNPEEVKNSITNALSKNCDPSIIWTSTTAEIRGQQVFVVRVPEGQNKPYVSEQGIYVRSTGTSRRATRREVDEIYQRRSNPERLGLSM